ncbi:hypothetical protein D3C76_1578610 [compost metagenome]
MLLRDIMLILAYANCLRLNLNKLSKWVLQTTSNGHCTAFCYIQVRKLLLCQLRCRIHTCSSFIDDQISQILILAVRNNLGYKLLCLTRRSTVANYNERNVVFIY